MQADDRKQRLIFNKSHIHLHTHTHTHTYAHTYTHTHTHTHAHSCSHGCKLPTKALLIKLNLLLQSRHRMFQQRRSRRSHATRATTRTYAATKGKLQRTGLSSYLALTTRTRVIKRRVSSCVPLGSLFCFSAGGAPSTCCHSFGWFSFQTHRRKGATTGTFKIFRGSII